ncbi:MAG: AAA family ATPase [Deltaproteobacteria bacterium]|nr:AAA family ATPase [Deltaproteobacteria bacterium]
MNHKPEESRALRSLREVFDAGRPLTYIKSAEEHRIVQLLTDAATSFFQPAVPVFAWSLTDGLRRCDGAGKQNPPAEDLSPRAVLDYIAKYDGPGLFLLKDFHEPLREGGEIRRRLRDLYEVCFDRRKFVFISSPLQFIPDELTRSIILIELGLPDLVEIFAFLHSEAPGIEAAGGKVDLSDKTLQQLGRALQGLTLDEARHAVRRAVAQTGSLGTDSLAALLEEKRLLVNRTGLVQYVADSTKLEQIGGLETLKSWLTDRRRLFLMRDEVSNDIVPKGVLIMGISGCGKSLSVKAIASCFELPLYRIDMTEIFSGRHGTPEYSFAAACRMLEQIAPAVCWFDEVEMAITSAENAGEQGRLFAFFLTWMQEKSRGLFVAATANSIDLLPAEMIRKGRFDEVFFVDLPSDEERVDVFRIHLLRRGIKPEAFNLDRLKRFTKGWTGAEVEQCVVSAMTTAKLEDRELNDDDILNATANIVPLSKTMKEQVDHIREWAFDRAVRASPREAGR